MRVPAPSKAKSLSLPVTLLHSRSLACFPINFKVQQLPSHPLSFRIGTKVGGAIHPKDNHCLPAIYALSFEVSYILFS